MDDDVKRFIFGTRYANLGFQPLLVTTIPSATIPIDSEGVSFEEIGYVVGGIVGGLSALPTAPIVLFDGPLPILDVAWAAGFSWAVWKGANYGGKAGRQIDSAIDLVS